MPTTLQEFLDKTQKGQVIVDMAQEFNFKNVRLYNSLTKDVLCLVVNSNPSNQNSINNNQSDNRSFLQDKISEAFNIKVIVLEEDDGLISSDSKTHIAANSVLLPLKTRLEELNVLGVFGNPKNFILKSLEEASYLNVKGPTTNKIL